MIRLGRPGGRSGGVYAAQAQRGASLVVWAVKDGRDAAEGIHRYVRAQASQEAMATPELAAAE